jgi:hypothetical protein
MQAEVKTAVVNRLRQTAQADQEALYQMGLEAGEKFATQAATIRELENLVDYYRAHFQPDSQTWLAKSNDEVFTFLPDQLFAAMRPEHADQADAGERFWMKAIGAGAAQLLRYGRFVEGLCAAAARVWDGVRADVLA